MKIWQDFLRKFENQEESSLDSAMNDGSSGDVDRNDRIVLSCM